MKPIRFSPHALGNLAIREIGRELVEQAIRNSDLRVPSLLPREVVTLAYYGEGWVRAFMQMRICMDFRPLPLRGIKPLHAPALADES